ncbi:MAG: sugar ABC transporter ATP-binding protein [Solobacterium sp.]|nr:sugar ABC transporter ATP-binding protein [Solobacterium sp.]
MNSIVAEHITKIYPGTIALDDVSISFESGKIHAFVGKNGSGKSTLMKIFAGAEQRSEGIIRLNGNEVNFKSPKEEFEVGIATVFQELSLVPSISVAENIFIGRLPVKANKLIDWDKVYADAKEVLNNLGLDIDPKTIVRDLPISQQQMVEIAKAMSFHPQVLQLDEPTSALSQSEAETLFALLQELKKQDVVIIFVSHRLDELWKIADDCVILRDGKLIGVLPMPESPRESVLQMMFGNLTVEKRPEDLSHTDETVLKVDHLTRPGKFQDISFEVKKGEVLGIAGMMGSGRTELLRAIFGADKFKSGTVEVKGQKVNNPTPNKMRNLGVSMLQEDRKTVGIIARDDIVMNTTMSIIDRLGNGIFYSQSKAEEATNKQVKALGIKLADIHNKMNSLSGGNQQKVIVGRWLNADPDIIFFDEPSRGIDVQSKQQIFKIIWDLSRQGITSVVVSSELEELLELCTRIIVMQQGKFTREITGKELEEMTIDQLYMICMEGIE